MKRRAPLRSMRPIQMLPNLMTLGAICAGLTSVRFAFDGNAGLSMSLIVLAAVLDGLDGTVARLLKSESEIGAELDSLADFVNFGVAPGLLLYLWALQSGRSAGWIAVLIYAICCAMRLARYNVSSRREPGKKKLFFSGVPAPGGALLVLMPLVLARVLPELFQPVLHTFAGIWLVLVGLMMISTVPTPSPKLLKVSRDKAAFVMVFAMGFIAAFFTWPWPVVLAVELGYLSLLGRFALRRKHLMSEEN